MSTGDSGRTRREAALEAVLLAGSALLLGLSIWRLPPSADLLSAPSTPFDRSMAASSVPDFRFFEMARSVLPPGATVTAICEPRNPVRETWLHRLAVPLLPRQRVLAAALWGVPRPDLEQKAGFVIVAGGRPSPAPGRLLLETPWGTVWKKARP